MVAMMKELRMSEFISRAKFNAIKLALLKVYGGQLQAALPGLDEELYAAAQTGDVAAVRAVLKAKSEELSASFDAAVAAAIAEIQADAD
jgi:hypothetical protein